jgi:hypothetical protein
MLDRYEIAHFNSFIETDDLSYFQKYCSNVTEWSNYSEDYYIGHMFWTKPEKNKVCSKLHGPDLISDKKLLSLFQKYAVKIKEAVQLEYGVDLHSEKEHNYISCYDVGAGLPLHGDEGWPGFVNATPNGFSPITHGVIVYITGDYTGGELVVPWYDKRYKTEAGSILIIPSGNGNEHLVEPVESGKRWIWATFWSARVDTMHM